MNQSPPTVAALGELLWDVFPDGARFGGAPINFAHHVSQLGAQTSVVTAVGDDELGTRAIDRLRQSRVDVDHVAVHPTLPTGSVDVSLDDQGVASYRFHDREAWDEVTWSDGLGRLAERCDAICFGTLGQRSEVSRATIQRFVQSTRPSALRVLDLNLRAPYFDETIVQESLRISNVLKINEEELTYLAGQLSLSGSGDIELASNLAAQCEMTMVAVTRGAKGSLLIRGAEIDEVESPKTEVKDTVGAGDSFTAALVIGALSGQSLAAINAFGASVAAFVCTQSGATPQLPADFLDRLGRPA